MLLTVNVGNSNVRFGVFEQNNCTVSWVINSKPHRSRDEYFTIFKSMYNQFGIDLKQIGGIVIGSVVPHLTYDIKGALKKLHEIEPIVVDRYSISNIKHNSHQMGTDLYANAVAAEGIYTGKKIVIDFGTALTVTGIDESSNLMGIVIAPGVMTSLNALIGDTAQLPEITLTTPKQVLGAHTEACMQSGIIYGYLGMVEGFIDRINKEVNDSCYVIATGGLSHIYGPLSTKINTTDKLHTLRGLKMLYDNNN